MISWIGYTLIEIKRIERATPRSGVIFDALSARGHFRSSPKSWPALAALYLSWWAPRSGRLALRGPGPCQIDWFDL